MEKDTFLCTMCELSIYAFVFFNYNELSCVNTFHIWSSNMLYPYYSDSPLDLKIKGNMLCDLFSLTGKLACFCQVC